MTAYRSIHVPNEVSVNVIAASLQDQPAVADPVIAYAEWRFSSTAVWAAYRHWSKAGKAEAALAYAAFMAALDREDAAARAYSRLMKLRTGRNPGAGEGTG
jgi:hypothetical protein